MFSSSGAKQLLALRLQDEQLDTQTDVRHPRCLQTPTILRHILRHLTAALF